MLQGHEYPFYTELPNDRDQVTLYLAFASFLSVAVGYAVVHRDPREFFQTWAIVGASAPLVVFACLSWLMENVLWKVAIVKKFFRLAKVPLPPNIAGDYRVAVKWYDSNHEEGQQPSGESEAILTIIQSWKRISVVLNFTKGSSATPNAESNSRTANLQCTADPRRVLLEYTYEYEGRGVRDSGNGLLIRRINGTSTLTLACDEAKEGDDANCIWKVSGHYYSDDGGTGEITQLTN